MNQYRSLQDYNHISIIYIYIYIYVYIYINAQHVAFFIDWPLAISFGWPIWTCKLQQWMASAFFLFSPFFFFFSCHISVRLFQLLGAEMHVSVKAGATCAFDSAKNATFWKKLRFGPRLKTCWERAKLMERWRSIKQKAHARWNYLLG